MKKALFPVLFLCFPLTDFAKAQDSTATKCNKKTDDCSSDCSPKKSRFWYDAGFGMQALEMSNINTKFKDAGFNEVATKPVVMSLAGGMIYKKHSFGFSMSFASPKNRSNDQLTEMSLIRSDMMYGYSFKLAKKFTFVPTIGIGMF